MLATARALGIAVDQNEVYWAGDTSIRKISTSGGAITTLAPGQVAPDGIAVAGGRVYWTTQGGNIFSTLTNGGAVTTISTGWGNMGYGLAIGGGDLLWPTLNSNGTATIGAWKMSSNFPPFASEVRTVVNSGSAQHLTTDGVYVYWTSLSSNSISKTPLTGGAAIPVSNEAGTAIAIDCASLYWASSSGIHRLTPR